MKSSAYWIKNLDLLPHPEGGFYKEIYRSEETIDQSALPKRYNADRNFSTSIFFLLRSSDISALHKIASDEIWYFHDGSPVDIFILKETGPEIIRLGKDIEKGETLQALIPKEHWFGAKVVSSESFVLVSCSVAPGFDFKDFTLGERAELLKSFPLMENVITELTKS